MKVKQVMLENPRTLHCSKTIQDASLLYRETKVNCAPIVNDEEKVVGILTVFRLLEAIEKGATFDTRVDQIMERHLEIIDEDTSFHDISEQTIDRLLIFNNQQRLTGVLTRIDLINKVHGALMNSEDKLAEAFEVNKELRSVIEASYDGIIVVDSQGLIQIVNKSFYRVQGSDHDPVGEPIDKLGIVCRELLIQVYQRVLSNGIVTFDRYKGKDLTELAITGSPVLDEQNHIVRVVISLRDFTELNQLKLKSERYSHELKSLRAKEQKDLIYHSSAMERVVNEALRVSEVDSTVLITGESGVGKEVIARTIHLNSPRAEGPFIQINTGAIPENLLESELFGYERGAFTGANKEGKPGMMELANGGTLLLDEVGDMPLNLQVKLLRAIQEQAIFRIGGRMPIKLDIRILSATNKNLQQLVSEKMFREDLYYRLNVVPIKIPPLRERKSDILPLAKHFLDKVNERYKMQKYFSSEVCKLLEEYSWPGNIRELSNLVERLVIMTDQDTIYPDQLPDWFTSNFPSSPLRVSIDQLVPLKEARDIVEAELIIKALKEHKSLRRAGDILGVAHSTLLRKARTLGISFTD